MLARLQLAILLACLAAAPAAFAQSEDFTVGEDYEAEDYEAEDYEAEDYEAEDYEAEYYEGEQAGGIAAQFANFQPRLQTPSGAVLPETSRSTRSQARSFSSYTRLARAPNMFGDLGSLSAGRLYVNNDNGNATSDLPLGGGRSFKIGENNKPIPMDRVYFNFNGYQNAVAISTSASGRPTLRDSNLNQYTFGFEKTFLDGDWSLDVRMPITDGFQGTTPGFSIDSGRFGNMAAYLKHRCYQGEFLAISAGFGLGLPTGSNVDAFADGWQLTVQNDAVHLLPYIGFFHQRNEDWFMQGFVGLDFATTGNDVVLGPSGRVLGRLNEQNLAYADLSWGRWLYRNPDARYSQGLAGVFELHYTTTIQDADTIELARSSQYGSLLGTLYNPPNRLDLLNITMGLHWQITELSNFRVGCAVPLRPDPDRAFDSEIQASFNRHF